MVVLNVLTPPGAKEKGLFFRKFYPFFAAFFQKYAVGDNLICKPKKIPLGVVFFCLFWETAPFPMFTFC